MRLTTQNAEITTAHVEVKALTISGKQVTLSVFRQLPEAQIVDEENLRLRGIPWGWVNYLCKNEDGINVVWQDGNRLYRCEVSLSESEYRAAAQTSNINKQLFSQLEYGFHRAIVAHKGRIVTRLLRYMDVDILDADLNVIYSGVYGGFERPLSVYTLDKTVKPETVPPNHTIFAEDDACVYVHTNLDEWREILHQHRDTINKCNEIKRRIGEVRDYRLDVYTQLRELPQLFIAV